MLLSGFVINDKRRTQNTYTHILQENNHKENKNDDIAKYRLRLEGVIGVTRDL